MKYLHKYILSILLFIIGVGVVSITVAQDKPQYNWQLGFGIGSTNYYGDLSNYRINGSNELYKIYRFANYNSYYQHQPSFSILLQKKITPTLGIMFQANNLQFGMSDRYRKNNGLLDTASANFARSLNFRTTMQDAGLAFTFSPNNGRIGSENAFFYPSFYLGLGVSKFVVKGDLYDQNNNPYNYRLPGNITDNTYETNLRDLRTETDSKFRDVEPYVDLGLALNFRINQLLTIALQSDIKYSASDYLDGVSSKYKSSYPTAGEAYAAKPGYNNVDPVTMNRGDNNGVNDFYINNRIVLNISLSKKKTNKTFNPPVIYSLGTPYFYQKKIADSIKKNISHNADSVMRIKSDSVSRAIKDSLSMIKSGLVQPADSIVRKQLENINSELKDIKEVLRDQQIVPRLQQLQYQTDSIKNLRSRLLIQRPLSKDNNLLLRVYDLQIDSLRNEYEKAQQRQKLPLSKADSSILYYRSNIPLKEIKTDKRGNDKTSDDYIEDSVRVRNSYLKKIDSIEQRLNELESTPSGNNQQGVVTESINKNASDSLDALRNKEETDNQLRREEENQAQLRQQLIAANDSAAYYKKLQQESMQNFNPDTIQKKTTWFQRYFGLGDKKKKRVVNADTLQTVTYSRQNNTPDTIQKKTTWFQRYFGTGNKKKKRVVKTDTHQAVDYSRQQEYYESEATIANKQIDKIENDKSDLAEKRISYAREKNLIIDSSELNRNVNLIQKRIQQNADSITLLQRQLQKSNDSGAYYRRIMSEASDNVEVADRKWYQDIFTSKKKKQKRIEAASNNGESNIQQQQYYENDIKNMRNRINDLERRNRELQSSYQSYNSDRNRRGNNYPMNPVFVYDENKNRNNGQEEIANLRAQLQNLQNEINYNASGKITDTAITGKSQQSALTTSNPVSSADTSQVSQLRNELNQLRLQLDSLKNKPVPVVSEKIIKPEQKFDVTGFPVISVYFKMGSVALTSDQLNKISPFGTVATKNKEAIITLKGFTDPIGNPEKNKIIANKRSAYVKNLLISKYKINDSRITIEEPVVSDVNTAKKANPLDRRVDLQFQ
jgi:outer membrane protein OmpA-like peptidoglycan-associated protein